MLRGCAFFLFAVLGMGCGPTATTPDASSEHDAARIDASAHDAGTDAGADGGMDAWSLDADDDAGLEDAGDDAGDDASTDDAGDDASAIDAGTDADLDASAFDAALDVGPIDGGIVRTEDPPTHPTATPIAPFTTCTVTTASDVVSGSEHRPNCDAIDYPYLPPTSGPHYGNWAAFTTYGDPVPRGFLVHAMEHGAVVLSYHCATATDCDAVRDAFATIVADRGLDPVCRDEDTPQRIVIVPDPTLTVPIAATAWGHVYTATCLDPASLAAFVEAHYAMAPENFCFPGVDFSTTGWCPP